MKKLILITVVFFSVLSASSQVNQKPTPIPYDDAGVKPLFPGGNNEFMKYIAKNFTAPEEGGYSGVVKVSFVIEMDGSIGDVKVIKDIGGGIGDEAKRVVLKSPKWTPGQNMGEVVRVLYELPITIRY